MIRFWWLNLVATVLWILFGMVTAVVVSWFLVIMGTVHIIAAVARMGES